MSHGQKASVNKKMAFSEAKKNRGHVKLSGTDSGTLVHQVEKDQCDILGAASHAEKALSTSVSDTLIKSCESDCHVRNVFCIPMECADPVPRPDSRLKDLLNKYGLKGRVNFSPNLTPAKIREDISRAFGKTFSLRNQELLQFDYLSLTPDKKVLTKPQNMHFDAKTIMSFADDEDVFILLRQTSPTQNINWKQLLQRESHILNLGEDEYREIMLSVMYRLSSGKHKKGSTQHQQDFIENLLDDYKLNSYHQLVHTGHGLQQLVLFTEKRRYEAFVNAHSSLHFNAQETYKNVFKAYYWRGMKEWITQQVDGCAECLRRSGKNDGSSKVDGIAIKKRKVESNGEGPLSHNQGGINSLPNEVIDKSLKFCANSMSEMFELQKSGTFCDFSILLLPSVSNGLEKTKTYDVHRVVLASISSRIRDIPKTSIKIGGNVTTDSLQAIIEYAYTGQLSKVQELSLNIISQISNTALALNVRIDDYLQNVRPDFTKSSAKVLVTKDPAHA